MSEQKQSRVVSANYKKSYAGRNGQTYVHEIVFENGDRGEYLANYETQRQFTPNEVATYKISEGRPYKGQPTYLISPVRGNVSNDNRAPRGNTRGGYSKPSDGSRNASFALSYAKDVAAAHIAAGRDMKSTDILQVADKFYEWLNAKENGGAQ